MARIKDTIEAYRGAGVPEREIPGKVAELLGVGLDDVRAVLAEMRESDEGYRDKAMDEEELAGDLARLVANRDGELAEILIVVIQRYVDDWGDPMEIDPEHDARTHVRRLNGLLAALRREFGQG